MSVSTAHWRVMSEAELQRLREHWVGVQRGAARKVSALDKVIRERAKQREAEGK